MIRESETAPEDPLEVVRKELTDLYANVLSRRTIRAKIESTLRTYRDSLGHRAEFWLLLAAGAAIANPQTFGSAAAVYVSHASRCVDFAEEILGYRVLLHSELERRYNSTNVEMSSDERGKYLAVYLRAQRELQALAPELIAAY